MASWSRVLRHSADVAGIVPIIGGLGGFVRAAVWEEGSVTAALAFTPGFAMQLYMALAAGGVILLVRAYWSWIQSRRPSVRFRAIAPLIETAMAQTLDDLARSHEAGRAPFATSRTRTAVREVAYRLSDFGVPYPPLDGQEALGNWRAFFPRVLAASRVGKLKEARSLWREVARSIRDGGGE